MSTPRVVTVTAVTTATAVRDLPNQLDLTKGELGISLTNLIRASQSAHTAIDLATQRSSASPRSVPYSSQLVVHLISINSLSLAMWLTQGHTQPPSIPVPLWHWQPRLPRWTLYPSLSFLSPKTCP